MDEELVYAYERVYRALKSALGEVDPYIENFRNDLLRAWASTDLEDDVIEIFGDLIEV